MSLITCQLCGETTHIIQTHLNKCHHADSDDPCTIEEYRERYPEAPLMSEVAKAALAKKQAEEGGAPEKKAATRVEGSEGALHEVFGLGRAKAARTAKGDPVMISMCTQEDYPEFVPEVDENYVFDIDNLKTALMGLEANIPTYLYGHAGVGKSTVWEQIAARTNRRMVRVPHTGHTEESHIVGQWTVKKHKDEDTGQVISETVYELGPLPTAMLRGHVFLADEYDRAYPSVLSCYQAVLEGKPLFIKDAPEEFRVIKPHPDFRFVATGNTNGSGDETGLYQATVIQDAATFERFGIVHRVDYMPPKQEAAIVQAQARVSSDDAKAIIEFCTSIRKQHPAKISLTLGPRVAINIAKIGLMRGHYLKGCEAAFANRLPETEREAALQVASRIFGE